MKREPLSSKDSFLSLAATAMYQAGSRNITRCFLLTYKQFLEEEQIDIVNLWSNNFEEICFVEKMNPSIEDDEIHKPISERMLRFLQKWAELYPQDFSDKQLDALEKKIAKYYSKRTTRTFRAIFDKVREINKSKLEALDSTHSRESGSDSEGESSTTEGPSGKEQTPRPHHSTDKTSVLDAEKMNRMYSKCSCKEIAWILTLIEARMFVGIDERELVSLGWKDDATKSTCPSIVRLQERFKEVEYWVATQILIKPKRDSQTAMIKRFVKIAVYCLRVNNFNTMMEICAGLNHPAVLQLTGAWDDLDRKAKKRFAKIRELADPKDNFRKQIERFNDSPIPKLPFVEIVLREIALTFLETDRFLPDGSINVGRLESLERRARELQALKQGCCYDVAEDPTASPSAGGAKKRASPSRPNSSDNLQQQRRQEEQVKDEQVLNPEWGKRANLRDESSDARQERAEEESEEQKKRRLRRKRKELYLRNLYHVKDDQHLLRLAAKFNDSNANNKKRTHQDEGEESETDANKSSSSSSSSSPSKRKSSIEANIKEKEQVREYLAGSKVEDDVKFLSVYSPKGSERISLEVGSQAQQQHTGGSSCGESAASSIAEDKASDRAPNAANGDESSSSPRAGEETDRREERREFLV